MARAAHICALTALVFACCGLAFLFSATVYWFFAGDWVESLGHQWGRFVENAIGSGVLYCSILGLVLAIVAILLARRVGRREPSARRAIELVALLLVGCVVFGVAFLVKWAIDYS